MRSLGIQSRIMKKYFCILFTLIAPPCSGQITKKVLFLGNSYTYVNNLPQLISDLAMNTGDTLVFDSNTPGGYTLEQHFRDSNSVNKIKAGGWDYVVLQEQSQLPALPDYSGAEANELCALINAYNPCARALFYMTWGRKNGDASNCIAWPPVCTYQGMDSLLYQSYMEMASGNHAEVAPVGAVWKYIRQNFPAIELYQPDESHPGAAGSYAAACCFYSALFKKDPTLINNNFTLNASDAATIRNAAKTIVFDSLPAWDFVTTAPPSVAFNYTIGTGTNEILISNFTSENADFFNWDFGDGTVSTDENPGTHSYSADGTYLITLNASLCDLGVLYTTAYQKSVTFCPHNPTIFPDNLVLCPNTNDTLFTQTYDAYQWCDADQNPIPNETGNFFIPSAQQTYSVLTTVNGCTEMSPQAYVGTYLATNSFHVYITGNLNGADTACTGDTLLLVLTPNKPPFPDDQYITWSKDGSPIPGSGNDTLRVTTGGRYGVVLNHPVCAGYTVYENDTIPITFITCNPGITDIPSSQGLFVYPNPLRETATVKFLPEWNNSSYKLMDVYGSIIQSGTLESNQIQLGFSNCSNGVYIFRVENKLKTTSIRFIRQ